MDEEKRLGMGESGFRKMRVGPMEVKGCLER